MTKLEKTIHLLAATESNGKATVKSPDVRAMLLSSILYLILMLGVPFSKPEMLCMFAIYPIIAAPFCGISYNKIFVKSLWVLPLIVFIGIFNPLIDHTPAFTIDNLTVTNGWISFLMITVRGLLAMQVLLIIILSYGFSELCRALGQLGIPSFLTTQLFLVFRYLKVLLEQLLTMRRARESRGYGNTHYSLKMWGNLMGQLFLSTIDRSQRIHQAMLSRCFKGQIPSLHHSERKWRLRDTIWIIAWCSLFIILRAIPPATYLSFMKLY